MQPSLPLWLQPLPPELRRRLELAEATAREARLDTHAQQALHLVAVLAPRMPFDEAVERYIDIMGLMGEEAEMVHTRTLVGLGENAVGTDLARALGKGVSAGLKVVMPSLTGLLVPVLVVAGVVLFMKGGRRG